MQGCHASEVFNSILPPFLVKRILRNPSHAIGDRTSAAAGLGGEGPWSVHHFSMATTDLRGGTGFDPLHSPVRLRTIFHDHDSSEAFPLPQRSSVTARWAVGLGT